MLEECQSSLNRWEAKIPNFENRQGPKTFKEGQGTGTDWSVPCHFPHGKCDHFPTVAVPLGHLPKIQWRVSNRPGLNHLLTSCKALCSSRVGGHQKPCIFGGIPQKGEIREERSIAGQPKTIVNSDVSQSVEIGRLNCMASSKIIAPGLCLFLNVSKMHMFEAKMESIVIRSYQ